MDQQEFERALRSALGLETKKEDTKMQQEQKKDTTFSSKDMEIIKSGRAIILPNDPREMTEDEAIDQLNRLKAQNNLEVGIHEEVNAFPLEGAWALMNVLKRRYGWVNAQATPGFFGPNPPTMVTLETGVNETSQVIWGGFQVPGIIGQLQTGTTVNRDGRYVFAISGTVKKRFQGEVKAIADEVREFVRVNSLYKNKAIKLVTTKNKIGDYVLDTNNPPRFLDLSRINESELIFSDEVQGQVETNLFAPVEKTDECRKYKVPLKRTVLLAGPYGTGKTLLASVTGKKCVANGWTYIYLDRAEGLKDALLFARNYAPAVVFAEDIESEAGGEERSTRVNDVLNNIDGIDSKGQEVICVFTTNHVEKINKAMLRPGRIDSVIMVNPPDAKAAEKLVRVYSQDLIPTTEDLTSAGSELAGQIPAVIREVVERAKLYSLNLLAKGETLRLTGEAVRRSAVGMKEHLKLMRPIGTPPKSDATIMGEAMFKMMKDAGHYGTDNPSYRLPPSEEEVEAPVTLN